MKSYLVMTVLGNDRPGLVRSLADTVASHGGNWLESRMARLAGQFPGAQNPFPWMSEIMDLRKEKNFFETRVIEYQTGGALSWE